MIDYLLLEHDRLQEECEELKRKADECIQFKQNIIANISHEIRTPMNAILGFSELLNDNDLTENERREFFDIIKDSSERMNRVIQNLIELSEIQSSEIKINISTVNILSELEKLKNAFEEEAMKKGLDIKIAHDQIIGDIRVKADNEKLCKILYQLIKNSVQYTKMGIIELGYYKETNFYEIYVKDTGNLIPKDKIDKIFDSFFQVDMSLNRTHEGLGLGLCLAKSYAKLMGGDIVLEQDNSTKTFKVLLPNEYIYNS